MSEDQNKDPYEVRHEHQEVKVERVPLEETSDDGTPTSAESRVDSEETKVTKPVSDDSFSDESDESDEEAELAKQNDSLNAAKSSENDEANSAENSLDTETRDMEKTAKDVLSDEEASSAETFAETSPETSEDSSSRDASLDEGSLEAEEESVSIAHVNDDETADAEDDGAANGVEAIPKFDYLVRAEPKALKVFTGIFGVIFVLWLLLGIIAPFVLPDAATEANLPLLSEHHLLGTDGAGQDILLKTLGASQVSFALALIPTLFAALWMYLSARNFSRPGPKRSTAQKIATYFSQWPLTALCLILAFILGMYLPRMWVHIIVLFVLVLFVWLPEGLRYGRVLKRYRQYTPVQYTYYLGAREFDALFDYYGSQLHASYYLSLLRIFRRSFMIWSVLPFVDGTTMVPQRAGLASEILIPLKQGAALFVQERWPFFAAWLVTFVLATLLIYLLEPLAARHPIEKQEANPEVWRMRNEAK